MLRSTIACSFCFFDGLTSEGKKGENEVVLNGRGVSKEKNCFPVRRARFGLSPRPG